MVSTGLPYRSLRILTDQPSIARPQRVRSIRNLITVYFFLALAASGSAKVYALNSPTKTALSVSSSSIHSGSVFTLTATVTASGIPVFPGRVLFCDTAAAHCTENSAVGAVQLTGVGVATMKKLLTGTGTHSYFALFVGTTSFATSTSQTESVQVSGHLAPSVTTISKSGGPASYSLTAAVTGFGFPALTGNVSFLDSLNSSHEWGNVVLDPATVSAPQYVSGNETLYPINNGDFTEPNGLYTGDFNGDGVLDQAVVNYDDFETGQLQILFGDPAHPGQFLAPENIVLDSIGLGFAADDLNGDGVLDVVITLPIANQIVVYFGDAAHPGKFLAPVYYTVGNFPYNVVLADFNGDGLPDIVVVNSDDNTLSVFLSDAANPGTFPTQVLYPSGSGPAALAVADFNGDGWQDIGVANSGDGTIGVLLGDPAHPGTFLARASYPVSGASSSGFDALVVGDLNQDGVPDLIAGAGSTIDLLFGDPAQPGKFVTPVTIATTGMMQPFAVADMNQDGAPDLILNINGTQDGYATGVIFGDPKQPGHYGLENLATYVNGGYSVGSTVADFNGDGVLDFGLADPNYGLGIRTGAVTRTATVTLADVTPTQAGQFADAVYSGDSNYVPTTSCPIAFSNAPAASPVISGLYVDHITKTTAAIGWTSNVPTNGYASYDLLYTDNFESTPWEHDPTTFHYVVLTDLTPGTSYGFNVTAVSYFSGCTHWTTKSNFASFTTAEP